ncbi:YkvA family protein [Tenacibaculum piscium]|uniref:YkvA family protein n=1 Tax=Tenacibaculum piscium TaxID=1458515 RepID=UPI001F2EEA10|nr:YkvA family protein [Tenacibaculum piscium]
MDANQEKKSKKLFEQYSQEEISQEDFEKAEKKSKNLGEQMDNFKLLLEMLKDSWSGTYQLNKTSLAIIVGALLYVVSPLDAIPDIIPVFGWLDDITIVGYAMTKLKDVIQDYKNFKGIR